MGPVAASVLDAQANAAPNHPAVAEQAAILGRPSAARRRLLRRRAVSRQRERAASVIEAAVEEVLGAGAIDLRAERAIDVDALVALHEESEGIVQRAFFREGDADDPSRAFGFEKRVVHAGSGRWLRAKRGSKLAD